MIFECVNYRKLVSIQCERKVKNLPHPALRATLYSVSSVPLSRRARVYSPRPPGEGLGVRGAVLSNLNSYRKLKII
jgi:hypothetical protein